ncbi:hypothetical protein BDW62DRAFT_187754 [Aspergillus aurantiobrunneus]
MHAWGRDHFGKRCVFWLSCTLNGNACQMQRTWWSSNTDGRRHLHEQETRAGSLSAEGSGCDCSISISRSCPAKRLWLSPSGPCFG